MVEVPEPGWIESRLVASRPRALAALLRYFRDLDLAEEAFQEASLRALSKWPQNGPPRDPEAWLILVGRNATLDHVRRQSRLTELPDEHAVSDREDVEEDWAERLDESYYRDDILRLLFVCCHPDLPATQQIALALRVVSGLSVRQIAKNFLVSEAAMEQRITRAKARIARADIVFEPPGPVERSERFASVSRMIYLIFNEGYSDSGPDGDRASLCDEGIRLARLLLRLFPAEPEMMGLLALMLLSHSRKAARFDENGSLMLLEKQDRSRWNQGMIAEALAMIDKAIRHRRPGPYQIQAAISAIHARGKKAEETDWEEIDQLYAALERHDPSPVVTLNRAVAVSKVQGAKAALLMVEGLSEPLSGYFYFHGLRGALLKQLDRKPEAREALSRAISLATTAEEAAHIREHLDQLEAEHEVSSEKSVL
jgi:RNA polymerase sigma-70 factor (ECF subfamily)